MPQKDSKSFHSITFYKKIYSEQKKQKNTPQRMVYVNWNWSLYTENESKM